MFKVVTVAVSPSGVGCAAAATAAASVVFTQLACAVSANSIGKNAADIETNSAANKRSAFIISP